MSSVFVTAFFACLFCVVLTPVVRSIFLRWGIVDQPDGIRKLHRQPIPRVGGVAIAISYVAAYGVLLVSPLELGGVIERQMPLVWTMLPAASLAFFTGLADDLFGLKPWQKLAGQVLASALAFAAGLQISNLAGFAIPAWLSFPLTIIWLVGCTNAFNLIDGVDGLAAGVGLLATGTTFVAALLNHNVPLALATLPLAGCLLGFLLYNFNPASIFLGDSGSLLVGFLLGCYGVYWSQKSATILGMTAPLIALSLPLLDTALSILRRFLRGRPIFGADRGHVHHRLLDRGFTPRRVALMLYGVCSLAAGLSILLSVLRGRYPGLVVVAFLALIAYGIHKLGYAEFRAAGRLLRIEEFQSTLNSRVSLDHLSSAIRDAATASDCWDVLRDGARDFGFDLIELEIAGQHFANRWFRDDLSSIWQIHLPLPARGHVRLGRKLRADTDARSIVQFVDAVHRGLEEKEATLLERARATGLEADTESVIHLVEAIGTSVGEEAPTPRLVRIRERDDTTAAPI